jgi:hypothetical protein
MIASSYRTAAQYAELFDTRLAVESMLPASRAYLDAGAAFGLFPAAGAMSDEALRLVGGPRDRERQSGSGDDQAFRDYPDDSDDR